MPARMNTPQRNKGFTLIELLVVISVVALLSSILTQSLNTARVKSRNAARLANVDQIAKGFQIASTGADGNAFPSSEGMSVCLGKTSCWQWWFVNLTTVDAFLQTGMSGAPAVDPLFKTGQYGDVVVYDSNLTRDDINPEAYLVWGMEDQMGTMDDPCGRGVWAFDMEWFPVDSQVGSIPSYGCNLYLGPGSL